ncbi:hypothetical protein Pint_33360 [Pistacia integerrima]|uniref:Uncharacterized protein n=1 Tax=Pistacia integerrima TaxID=434235 RepID=A0ACC0X4Y7_9ROSI|nr:hypothetical protein Pint_33360 [Pistacia integerrima]
MILPLLVTWWNNFDRDAYAGGLVASKELVLSLMFTYSKPLLLSNLRTTKMNDDVLAIAVSVDAKYIVAALLECSLKFELLLTLEGHHADVWCLAISNSGDYIVTGSHDRSICHWDRIRANFIEEELPEEGAMALAGKKTQETLTTTDLIIEALDIAEEELDRIAQHEEEKTRGNVVEFQLDIRMLGLSPSHYVLRVRSQMLRLMIWRDLLGVTICRCSEASVILEGLGFQS